MLKNISWRKLIQNFRHLGFEGPYSGGKHLFIKKGHLKVHIPNHQPHRPAKAGRYAAVDPAVGGIYFLRPFIPAASRRVFWAKNKHSGDISPGLLNEILKQAGIDKEDWNQMKAGE
ncbi:MAG TPA: hypothetical protein VGA49_01815 [Patescibacteria group bacterium]